MLSTRDPPQNKKSTQTESERMEKIFQGNRHLKRMEQQYLYQNKGNNKGQQGNHIILQGVVQQEDITLVKKNMNPTWECLNIQGKSWRSSKKISTAKHSLQGIFNIQLSTIYIILQTKNQQGYCGTEQLTRSNRLNWYMQNLSHQRSKIYILFKYRWTIFKDRPHGRTLNKPQQIQEN